MPDAATIRATVERYAERHTAGDIDGILSCFAPDARAEDPVGTEPHVGTGALRKFFEGTHAMADKLEIVITGLIRVAGTHAAAFPMKAVTQIGDMNLVVEIIDVMTFDDDGRIATMTAYWAMEDAHPL